MGLRVGASLDPRTIELDVKIDDAKRGVPRLTVPSAGDVGDEWDDRGIAVNNAVELGDLVRLHAIRTGPGRAVHRLHVAVDAADASLRAFQESAPFGCMSGTELGSIVVNKGLEDALDVGANGVAIGGTAFAGLLCRSHSQGKGQENKQETLHRSSPSEGEDKQSEFPRELHEYIDLRDFGLHGNEHYLSENEQSTTGAASAKSAEAYQL